MASCRPLQNSQLALAATAAALLWGYAAIVPSEALAACVQSGASVECTDVDFNGFRSPQSLSVRIRAGTLVGNEITNATLGVCPLSFPAIALGSSSTVLNEGVISTGGVCGFGILVGRDSSVVNLGSIHTADFVSPGIVAGDNGTVRHAGNLTTALQGSAGILGGAGMRITAVAASRISTTGIGSSAIQSGPLATIVNDGQISTIGDASHGIDAGAGSVVMNNALIATSANNSIGVRIDGGTLTNAGEIRSTLIGSAFASTPTTGVMIAGNNAVFTNTTSGAVIATHIGIRLNASQGASFINGGLIDVSPAIQFDGSISPNGGAVVVSGGLGADMTNTGAIVARGGLPALLSLGPRIQLRNGGSIVGNVVFGGGDDSIITEASSSIDGSIDFGAGEDSIFFQGGGVLVRAITNAEFLSKSGPNALTFGRDISIGRQVSVLGGGGIIVDRSARITAPLTSSIGLIRGHGTIDGALDNSGTLAPGTGTEKGTLTVTGAFRQFQNGTLSVRVSPDGSSDKLAIGGPAIFAGTLAITYELAPGRAFQDGQRFEIVAPLGSILASTGELALTPPVLPFINAALVRAPSGALIVEIDRVSYSSAGTTESQRSAGRMLDRMRRASQTPLSATLDQLETASPERANTILSGLAPESPGGVQTLSLMALERLHENLAGGGPSLRRSAGRVAWVRGFSLSARPRHSNRLTDYDLRGGIAGVDMSFGTYGLGVAAARIDGDFKHDSDAANYDASILGVTVRYLGSHFDLGARIAYGNGSPELRRQRFIHSGNETLTSSASIDLWSMGLKGTLEESFGSLGFAPHLELTYHRAGIADVDERSTLAVRTARSAAESLRARGGVGVSGDLGRLRPFADLSVSAELLHLQPRIAASLIGAPGSEFDLLGESRRRVAFEAEAGLAAFVAPGIEVYAAGSMIANDITAGRTMTAGLSFRW